MERETGFGLATSSLGNWAHIVITDFSVSGSDFKRRKITEFPLLCFDCLLMEYKRSTHKGRPSRHCDHSQSLLRAKTPFFARGDLLHTALRSNVIVPESIPARRASRASFFLERGFPAVSGFIAASRIEPAAFRHHMTVVPILGAVVAHEIGHWLLGAKAHSPYAVMRSSWADNEFELANRHVPGFHS